MPKQALIMIDMQRGFLDSASPLCIPAAEGTVPACAALIGRVGFRRQAALGGLRRAPVGCVSGRIHRPAAGLCARKAPVLGVFPHKS